ncbi:MAG: YceI family protein [Acidimicrobiales bacterium]
MLRWIGALAVVIVVLAVGIPFIYIHLIEGPPPAALALPTDPPANSSSVAGTWQVSLGSTAGYRVREILVGQSNLAVGRTHDISGRMVISGTTVKSANFTVQMATVTSNEPIRDTAFRSTIMDTSTYPTASFVLRRPISLGRLPRVGAERTYHTQGNLTLRGKTRRVSLVLKTEQLGAKIYVLGDVNVVFAKWGIPNPSNAMTKTQQNGTLEFLLAFHRTAGAVSPIPSGTTTTYPAYTPASPTTIPPLKIGSASQ